MRLKLIFVVFFNSILSFGIAQTADSIGLKLRTLIENIKRNEYVQHDIIQELQLKNKPRVLLPLIEEYRLYPNPEVQKKIYEVYFNFAIQSDHHLFRKEMVNKLLCACTDSIRTSYACEYMESLLSDNYSSSQKIKKADYDVLAKRKLLTILNSYRFGVLYSQLIGFLGYNEAIPRLNQLIQLSKEYTYQQFEVILALARMGQKKAIKQIADSLSSISTLEDLNKNMDALKYVKQKEILPIISKILYSSTMVLLVESETPGEKDQYEPISNYAVDILSSVVEGFPIQYSDSRNYTAKDLKIARNWFKLNKTKIKFKTDEY